MSDTQKKQNFLQGTALLAMATAIVKVIGALYKIPLNAIIGEQGFGYFNTAYEIYNVLLMISTAGLPVAMSRMISQASSLEHYGQVRRIYASARGIFLALGIVGSLLMTVFCRQLAVFQNQPDAWAAIGCLGPCVLLICIMSTFRGFFQGQSNMLPTSISQVLEAITKLIVGMIAALALLKMTGSIPLAAGGAILGVTASCLLSSFYLFGCFRKSFKSLPVTNEPVTSYRDTIKGLLIIAIPITVGSAGLQILTMLETKIYMGQLLSHGFSQAEADTMRGIYGMTQTIFNMPCSFITPITISIIPAITAQLTLKNFKDAKATEESAARITGLISMPCAFGLAVLAEPVTALLGGYTGEKLALATQLMTVLGISIMFNAVVLVTTAIMQAHGHVNRPVVNMFIGGLLKLAAVYILTGNPNIGILGTPLGTLLCYLVITALNILSIRSLIPEAPALVKNLARPFLAAAFMGLLTWLSWYGLKRIGMDSRLILCGAPIAVGVVVYCLAAVKLKVVTREDCLLLPKGEKIAKLLKL
ncbi:MAG: polysaccharide biosynthesis protein [Oscillospiraceae bacterium]|jgi:stage V sporulation protein B|nr:polysaccharide biosynthesis protein [Oscillospiraceae bacterium]